MKTQNSGVDGWRIILRFMGALLFPPSRRRLRILWRVSRLQFRLILEFAHDPAEMFWKSMEEAANWAEEAAASNVSEDNNDLANLYQMLMELPKILKPVFKEELIPRYYIFETDAWIQAVLDRKNQQGIYANISKRIKGVLEGHAKPLFVPFTIPDPDTKLVGYLKSGNATQAIESIEALPFERILLLIPADSVLVHLIATDDGTYGTIVQKDRPPEIVLCKPFTRRKVENLLRGWMWLYYWHSEKIYDRAAERVIQRRNMSGEEGKGFEDAYQRIPYELLFHNQALFDHLQPTEIPTNDGIPAIPFPSWLLMEAVLRELGRGDFSAGEGLWRLLDGKISVRGTKRIILCPDKAFALFPHHGAILNIDRDGNKECVLDRYEIVYQPYGKLAQTIPAKLEAPHLLVIGTDGEEVSSVGRTNLCVLAPDHIAEWHASEGREKLVGEMSRINAMTFLGHGKYYWENPSRSFLGLLTDRNGSGYNDVITVKDLVQLISLHLNLIVLAGCETGLPKITAQVSDYEGFAEELLSRCGVSAVVSTLWPVPQVSTVLLMRQFHKYWLLGSEMANEELPTPATALRNAQLWLRGLTREQVIAELKGLVSVQSSEVIDKEIRIFGNSIVERPYAHPYFWSTYYIMGGASWIR